MSDRIEREELVRLVAQRTGQDVGTVDKVVDAFLDEIYYHAQSRLFLLY